MTGLLDCEGKTKASEQSRAEKKGLGVYHSKRKVCCMIQPYFIVEFSLSVLSYYLTCLQRLSII